MQPNIMPAGSLGLVMCILCVIMVVMMPMAVTASSSLLPLSPSPSPPATSILFDPPENQVQRGEEQYQVQQEILQEDYGNWNPAPNSGDYNAAPIPH
jgi:hypothetical protein